MGIYCTIVTFTFRDEDNICIGCTKIVNEVLKKLQQEGAKIIDIKPSSSSKMYEENYLTSYVVIIYESENPYLSPTQNNHKHPQRLYAF